MTWVIDASVIMKWFLTDDEADVAISLDLLEALRNESGFT